MKTGAVVIGGGLTGCLSAYALAAAGVKVVLLEANRIGRGETVRASGWIAGDPGVSFADLEQAIGLRSARRAWQAWRRAALDFMALMRRLDIKCHLEEVGAAIVANTPDQVARLKRDRKARVDAGIEAPALNSRTLARELALDAPAGLRSAGGTIDPYRACLGVAAAAADRGTLIFEKSPVRKIKFTRRTIDVFTAGGPIRAERVVIATGLPGELFKALARHFWFHTTYLVLTDPIPAKVRRLMGRFTETPPAVVRDSATPPHAIRWVGDDRILITGADTATALPRLRDKIVVQRTGQLMYELSTLYSDVSGVLPAYGWSTEYARTADGLPYVGAHRNYPFHLFAFGDSSHSVTGSYLASRIILRQYSGELDQADEVFGFHR